jgi:ParB family transcriptional regulator, chromosome partitioning protein
MLTTKPLSFFKTDPNQPRKHFTEADLLSLGASMKALGQLQPVGAKPDGILLWGERRYRAAQLAGLKELSVIITDRLLSDSDIRLIQLTENMLRADLSGHEKWLGCAELMTMNPQWQMKDLAGHLHLDPSMVTRLLSPSKCIEAAQNALREGKIGISDCYAISKLPPDEQASLLERKLSGASRDSIEQEGRKSRNSGKESVRLSRVKIAMPEGATVVVTGRSLGMSELVDLLLETIKEARKAAEQYDVKTFQSMMRDKAKRGAL